MLFHTRCRVCWPLLVVWSPATETAQVPINSSDGLDGTSSGALEKDIAKISPKGEECVSRSGRRKKRERDGEHSKLNLNNRMEEPTTLSCSEPNNPKDGEPGGQRAKLKTNACPEDQHVPSPSRDVMPSMDQINLGENSPEASVYSALVGYHDANAPWSEARFPETETMGCTSSVKTLLDSMLNSKDKYGSHLIKSTQTPLVSAGCQCSMV